MNRSLACLCLLLILFLAGACEKGPVTGTTAEESSNPFVGTWVLNVARSEFNPPDSALKSEVVAIRSQKNGLIFTFDIVDAEGNETRAETAPKFDEELYPVTGSDFEESIKMRRVDARSFEHVTFYGGEEISSVLVTVSDDGETSTATVKSRDESEQEITSTLIYEKR